MGLRDPLRVFSLLPVAYDAVCILHLDYSFSSCFLHRHRENTHEALPSQTPPASKILKGEEVSKAHATPVPTSRQRERGEVAKIGRQQDKTEPASVSDHCQDSDQEELLRQDGGIIKKSGKNIVITVYCRQLKLKCSALNCH